MSFNLESGKNKEINETPEVKVDSEQLSETEETAENFDDCFLNEVQDSKGNEVNAESLEEAEENYDDCEAEMAEMEEKNPELAEEDDDFNDCGKETDGQYVAEVTYTTDGEISQEEASAELQEAYDECDDPEDMQQLKENANENEHIEVHNAEVVERPESDEVADEVTEEEYEQAQEKLEEAEETLEAQQEAAQEYKDDLENQINKNENEVPEGTENIDNDASEVEENQEETSETKEGTDEGDEAEANEISEDDAKQLEDTEETESFKTEENTENVELDGEQVEEQAESTDETVETSDENSEDVDEGASSEAEENTEVAEFDGEQVEEQAESTDETAETSDENSEDVDEGTSFETEKNTEDVEFDNLEEMDDDTKVEASEINDESLSGDVSKKVEEQTETQFSDETKEQIQEFIAENIDNEAEDGKVSTEKAEEIINENVEETVDNIEKQKEFADETIDTHAEKIVENEDLTADEAKEQIFDEVKESADENLSDKEAETIAEEKSDEIEDTTEEKKEEQKSVETIEETAEELENDHVEQDSEVESKSLKERIDSAFEKDDVSSSEINDLREENATELQVKVKEKAAMEAELKSKFDEVLSKEKGSEEYKQSLREYNNLQDQKANLDEQIATMEKRQELLNQKNLELRDAQIQKGTEAVVASATTLAGVSALQERYDQTYYDTKLDRRELTNIREESCSTIKELSAEKDSIKQAMDAKMDEISEYVTSNNMDRYDTAHDLRYQQLSAEYNAMRESYNRIGYSIVKLDENNKAITEQLGDDFHSMREAGCATFGSYKVDKFGFVMGDNGEQYSEFWEHYDKMPSQVTYYDEPIVDTVSPSKIEGIHIGDVDIDNPRLFWSQHMSDGSEVSFNSIAQKIPDVRMRLASGETLDSIIHDSELGDTAAIYFSSRQIPEVVKCGDYYEFQENGRHRILAARNVNCDILVKVIGERKFTETNITEMDKNFVSEVNDSKEYSEYMSSKYKIAVDQTVDNLELQTVKRATVGFESVVKEYPEVGELVNETTTSNSGVMACTGDTLLFNPEYFRDKDALSNVCKEMSDSGYWVPNSSPESIGVHEAVHGIEWALIQKNPAYTTEAERIRAWNNCTEASKIVSEACNNIKKSTNGRNKSSTQLVSEISTYALDSDSETMAEAFADVYANRDNAKPLSKEIVRITQNKMNEYRKETVYANKKSSPLGRIFRNR